MKENIYDLIIIGSGPGGYVAAIRAAQLKKKVLVIEKNDLGGICLNWGCIPTKSLLRSSEILHYMKTGKSFGLNNSEKFSIKEIIERSRKVSKQLSNGIEYLFKKNLIETQKGVAYIKDKNTIEIRNKTKTYLVNTKNIIIATGASPILPSFAEKLKNDIWNYKNALSTDSLPDKLGIIGSGAIGIEFASFFNELGVEVHIFEARNKIIPMEDNDISDALEKSLTKKGITFHKNFNVNNIEKNKYFEIHSSNSSKKETFYFDKILVAIGVVGNTSNIGIENTKVKIEKNKITTYKHSKTDEPNIFAIGDVAGLPWLAHKASHEGINCVEHIFNGSKPNIVNSNSIPSCVYSNPQVASIGISEQEAFKLNKNIKVGKFFFKGNGKALALGDSEGFIKTIFDKDTGEILGAHMIGPEVTELINTFSLAIKLEATEEDLISTIFPHPTLSEAIHESVLDAYDRSIHS